MGVIGDLHGLGTFYLWKLYHLILLQACLLYTELQLVPAMTSRQMLYFTSASLQALNVQGSVKQGSAGFRTTTNNHKLFVRRSAVFSIASQNSFIC